jgi:hypothetical protein
MRSRMQPGFFFGGPEPFSQMEHCNKRIAILSYLIFFAIARDFFLGPRESLDPWNPWLRP